MEYLRDNSIKDFVIDVLIDELVDCKDSSTYACELGYTLLETYNIDSVYFYNNYQAVEFIKKHFDDFKEIVEEITLNFGSENIPNVFKQPDRFCIVCFLEVASYLCSNCKYIDDNWNNEILLDEKTIEIIKNELESLRG